MSAQQQAQLQQAQSQGLIPTQEQANGLLGPAPEGMQQQAYMPNQFLMGQLAESMPGMNPYSLLGGGAAIRSFGPETGVEAGKKKKAAAEKAAGGPVTPAYLMPQDYTGSGA